MIAGYTYGPLLGLFTVGLFTKWNLNDTKVPIICVLAPIITYILANYLIKPLTSYEIGNELILINASFTIIGLLMVKSPKNTVII